MDINNKTHIRIILTIKSKLVKISEILQTGILRGGTGRQHNGEESYEHRRKNSEQLPEIKNEKLLLWKEKQQFHII